MSQFIIHGGRSIDGTIRPQGSKNEALQLLCAVLLTEESITLHHLPEIDDVKTMIHLLQTLDVSVVHLGEGSYTFCAKMLHHEALHSPHFQSSFSKVRGSIMLVAPLLVRFGSAIIPKPGGDRIGRRGIHAHVNGLAKLGGHFTYDEQQRTWHVKAKELQGGYLLMSEPSVTGTANVIMGAVRAKGTTTIYNAACEPHVQQLCHMLIAMGANIKNIGTNYLTIQGVKELGGTEHNIMPDMLEVGSFVGLAAVTQSNLTITNVPVQLFHPIWNVFTNKLGIKLTFDKENHTVHIPKQGIYQIPSSSDGTLPALSDAVWPGFPTDLISIAIVVALHAEGHILMHQKLYESRLFFVDRLIEMGAPLVLCDPHRVHIVGIGYRYKLQGIHMSSSDIRAGIALLIAALAADGTSVIGNIGQIDRGYQSIETRLNQLGASITRTS